MSEENTLANETTVTDTASQAATKTYTQEEFDNHMAGLKSSLTKKFQKQYEGLGDIEELRELKAKAEQERIDAAKSRGEFETVLSELATKKDAEIAKRDKVIHEYKVNVPLLSAAAKLNAVNAEQVKQLLSDKVRLNDTGDVEVIDAKGAVRYSDDGKAIGVDDLVNEFLTANPHFKAATPATTSTKTNITTKGNKEIDVTKLDMKKASDRKIYKEYKKAKGLT